MMCSLLTVKNTFLNFELDSLHSSSHKSGLPRSSSDPTFDTLFRNAIEEPEVELASEKTMKDVDRESSTVDDDDLDGGTAWESMCLSASSSSGCNTPPAENQIAAVDTSSIAVLREQVERLAWENKRLETSNLQLQEACRAQCTAVASAPLDGNLCSSAPASYGSVEIDGVQKYMCFAMPLPWLPQVDILQAQTQLPFQDLQCPQRSREEDTKAKAKVSPPAKQAGECLPEEQRTTVMLRNLPNNYSSSMLIDMINSEGFAGKYDFFYLPMDFATCACLGYAFVNLCDPADARLFWETFDGYSRWVIPTKKTCYVSWSDPHQGLQANIDRYKNSPVMHETVPAEYKPRLYRDGVQVPFPLASRKVRPPRQRR